MPRAPWVLAVPLFALALAPTASAFPVDPGPSSATVTSDVTLLSGGLYRYDYRLLNAPTGPAQPGEPTGLVAFDLSGYFHDDFTIQSVPAGWSVAHGPGELTFTAPPDAAVADGVLATFSFLSPQKPDLLTYYATYATTLGVEAGGGPPGASPGLRVFHIEQGQVLGPSFFPAPEPASLTLLGLGGGLLLAFRRRRGVMVR